jgi:guanyl-specific ribonuclease Sa
MNTKKTAVDFLVKEISDILGAIKTEPMQDLLLVDSIQKAKEMEMLQIMDACLSGFKDGILYTNKEKMIYESPKQYYKETYEQ